MAIHTCKILATDNLDIFILY